MSRIAIFLTEILSIELRKQRVENTLLCGNEQFSDSDGMFYYEFDAKKRMSVRSR